MKQVMYLTTTFVLATCQSNEAKQNSGWNYDDTSQSSGFQKAPFFEMEIDSGVHPSTDTSKFYDQWCGVKTYLGRGGRSNQEDSTAEQPNL